METSHSDEVQRVLTELDHAIDESFVDSAWERLQAQPFASDRRRNERRGVVPDRRTAERRRGD